MRCTLLNALYMRVKCTLPHQMRVTPAHHLRVQQIAARTNAHPEGDRGRIVCGEVRRFGIVNAQMRVEPLFNGQKGVFAP